MACKVTIEISSSVCFDMIAQFPSRITQIYCEMLTELDNELLSNVSWDSPMAKVLRHYWYPLTSISDLEACPVKPIKAFGRNLVLFLTEQHAPAILDSVCPHRGANLSLGIPSKNGLRCAYHGWEYSDAGICLHRPFERNKEAKICIDSFPTKNYNGIIFGYFGDKPAPELPPYDLCRTSNCKRRIRVARIPCNWLQIVENSLDPIHLEWLHGHLTNYQENCAGQPNAFNIQAHKKILFERTQFGIVKRRIIEGQNKSCDDWQIGQHFLMPTWFRVGTEQRYSLHVRLPNDTFNTTYLWIDYFLDIPASSGDPVEVEEINFKTVSHETKCNTIDEQDIAILLSQGKIAPRTMENLGASDVGIILLRNLLMDQIQDSQSGKDPIGVFRKQTRTIAFPDLQTTEKILTPLGTKSLRIKPKDNADG